MKRIHNWKEMRVGRIYKLKYNYGSSYIIMKLQKRNSERINFKIIASNKSYFKMGRIGFDYSDMINKEIKTYEMTRDEYLMEML